MEIQGCLGALSSLALEQLLAKHSVQNYCFIALFYYSAISIQKLAGYPIYSPFKNLWCFLVSQQRPQFSFFPIDSTTSSAISLSVNVVSAAAIPSSIMVRQKGQDVTINPGLSGLTTPTALDA